MKEREQRNLGDELDECGGMKQGERVSRRKGEGRLDKQRRLKKR
jgi:hypothetical protein